MRTLRQLLFPTFYEREEYQAYRKQKILNARKRGIDRANVEDGIIASERVLSESTY